MITRSNAWVLTALPESAAVSPPLKVCLQLPPPGGSAQLSLWKPNKHGQPDKQGQDALGRWEGLQRIPPPRHVLQYFANQEE